MSHENSAKTLCANSVQYNFPKNQILEVSLTQKSWGGENWCSLYKQGSPFAIGFWATEDVARRLAADPRSLKVFLQIVARERQELQEWHSDLIVRYGNAGERLNA